MKMKLLLLAIVTTVTMLLTGCYSTVDGRAKAGVPFKKDRIDGRYERSVAQVFEAAKTVVIRFGKIQSEDTVNKVIVGNVDARNVWIKVEELEPKVTRVTVQVRKKSGGTDIELAAQLEKEIALQLVQTK